MLAVTDRGVRADGESRVDGALIATRRDVGRTLSFVPKGHVLSGSFVPQVLPRCGALYIDPALPEAAPELGFAEIAFQPRLSFNDPMLWTTARKILALIEDADANQLYAEALVATLAVELVHSKERGGLRPALARGGLAEWQRRLAVEFINDNLDRNISLKELSGLVHQSAGHFSQAFSLSMGMPPHQYQLRQRIERAKLLLADTERSITEVALAIGYSEASNFATAFRRVEGLTPREFRRSAVS
jgi:AraC family transcriptional regulator